MPFSQSVKRKVKEKSSFKCCRCKLDLPLQVHHLIPEHEGGPNTIDNAVPLCPNCHVWFGNNPDHRNELRQARNRWYDQCSQSNALVDSTEIANRILEAAPDLRRIGAILDDAARREVAKLAHKANTEDRVASAECEVSLENTADRVVVVCEGDLDSFTVVGFNRIVDKAIALNATACTLIDLTRLEYMDSSGMSSLVRALKHAIERGGDLELVVTDPRILRLFKNVGLDRLFRIRGVESQDPIPSPPPIPLPPCSPPQ